MSDFADALKQGPDNQLKLLFFDIETAPMLAFIWQAKTDYVNTGQISHETFLLTWAAKWHDSEKVHGAKLTRQEALAQDDGRIVQSLAAMIRKADIVCGHNLNRFDIPMLNNRLLLLGLEPLGNVRTLDTLTLARKSFRLASNKLDWLAQQLGLGNKIGTSFSLWKRCYRGEAKALTEMLTYNKKDVTLLQDVFERMRPYLSGVPRLAEAEFERQRICPTCGGGDLEPSGFYRTNASSFPKFRCAGCGRECRARAAVKSRSVGLHPL